MTAAQERRPFWANLVFWGGALTLALFAVYALLAVRTACPDCPSKWDLFLAAPPNEVGDTLAGAVGALAFLWIIVTVLLQRQELKAQREEFEWMSGAMEHQAQIFENEKRFREQDRNARIADRMLLDLHALAAEERGLSGHWELSEPLMRRDGDGAAYYREGERGFRLFDGAGATGAGERPAIDAAIRRLVRTAEEMGPALAREAAEGRLARRSRNRVWLHTLLERLRTLPFATMDLSEDQRLRVSSLGLARLVEALQEVAALDVWAEAAR